MTASCFTQLREDIEQRVRWPNVAALLDEAAKRFGSSPALNFFEGGVILSFTDVQQWSMRLAAELRSRGVGVGTVVAVVMPNVALFPIAWMALLRLGAVLVPVNPRFTEEEVRFVLQDSGSQFVIAHNTTEPLVQNASAVHPQRVLTWHEDELDTFTVVGQSCRLPATITAVTWPDVTEQDVAGYHYTSGTTGFPKGCVLSHDSWLVIAAVIEGVLPRRPRRILSDTPFFYMDAPMELMLALASGAEQYVAKKPSLSRVTRWIADHQIDYAELWEALSDRIVDPESEELLRSRPLSLMASTYGLREGARGPMEQRFNAKIREFFGMTEIGIGMVEPFENGGPDDGSCGVAAPFRETRVVDPNTGRDVGAGVVGELWVRGRGILLRYHNRPEANRDVFVDDWFRTGDLVAKSLEGRHRLVGRIKDMVRRSHENIAANEVEEALAQVDGLVASAVVGVPDTLRGEEVKAFVVLKTGATAESVPPALVLGWVAKVLAPFKVPRFLEYVDELPMTPSGKVSKAKLRERDAGIQPAGWDALEAVWRHR